jgi:hypothetical protein
MLEVVELLDPKSTPQKHIENPNAVGEFIEAVKRSYDSKGAFVTALLRFWNQPNIEWTIH